MNEFLKVICFSKDDQKAAEVFNVLEKDGIDVRLVTSSSQLFFEIDEEIPAIIIIDTRDNSEAFDICSEIKNDRKLYKIPTLLLVEKFDREYINRLYASGGAGYISRDFPEAELLEKINWHISLLTRESDNHRLNEIINDAYTRISKLNDNLNEKNLKIDKLSADMVDLKEELKQADIYDKNTGLFNRLYGEKQLSILLDRFDRKAIVSSAILVEIDSLALYGAKYGEHSKMDLIKLVGRIINQRKRQSDIIVQWTEERFLILLPDTEKEGAIFFAERALSNVNKTKHQLAGDNLEISISMGLAVCDKHVSYDFFESMLENALNKSLNTGGNMLSY